MTTTLKHLLYFSTQLFKELILYIVLALDVVGVLITYYTALKLPGWFLVILPIVAIYVASFNIYKKGAADIAILILNSDEIEFRCATGHNEICTSFSGAIHGHFVNFGPQAGVIERLSLELGVNGIFDSFIIKNTAMGITISPVIKGHVSSSYRTYLVEVSSKESRNQINLPLVLPASAIEPFTVIATISVGINTALKNAEYIDWLKQLNINIDYVARQSNGVKQQLIKIVAPIRGLESEASRHRADFEKHRG